MFLGISGLIILRHWLRDQLLVKNLDKHGDLASFIGELKTVAQKIEEYLFVPSLITEHLLN